MTNDYQRHKAIMLKILKDIYTDAEIAPHLGFKGGTAALLFYGLNRNSVDLDFDLLNENRKEVVFDKIQRITAEYGSVVDAHAKKYGLLIVVAYAAGAPRIKVEVSCRDFGSRYELKTLLGISMLVMVKEDMYANKLMAMAERIGQTSRDVFDVNHFEKIGWDINQAIVENRSGKPFEEALSHCIHLLENMDNRRILDGLGELMTDQQKDWARAKLKEETIFLLKVRLDGLRK
jgi:predicted nucleotidyltransferase component of viral defense system